MLNDQGRIDQGLPNIDPDASANRRTDQRHMSVFRVGKLITSRGQELCLIRNISSGGLMAHIYSAQDAQERVEIELKAGKTVKGLVVWSRDRKIGVQFDEKIDVAEVLAPQPGETDQVARAPRLNIRRRDASVSARITSSLKSRIFRRGAPSWARPAMPRLMMRSSCCLRGCPL